MPQVHEELCATSSRAGLLHILTALRLPCDCGNGWWCPDLSLQFQDHHEFSSRTICPVFSPKCMFPSELRGARGSVGEAFEAGSVVGVDEIGHEGIALGGGGEAVFAAIGRAGQGAGQGFDDAAVEGFDHAVSLGMAGLGQPMGDAVTAADRVQGMPP